MLRDLGPFKRKRGKREGRLRLIPTDKRLRREEIANSNANEQ
jgi:hypothetical protein